MIVVIGTTKKNVITFTKNKRTALMKQKIEKFIETHWVAYLVFWFGIGFILVQNV
jgi:hypothetical protein